jgi:alginate O-acetyltransferase complex protein AlgI
MLFNSYEFIFLFLPIALIGFHLIGKQGHYRIAIAWLVGASLFFYSWWNPAYLGLMLFSILFNYSIGVFLGNFSTHQLSKKTILTIAIVVNLSTLGYFKYANFFIDNLNDLTGSNIVLQQIILPLAISFFTFQQIAYLVDAYRKETKEYNFLHYCLFVTFFPQLIAGPIVHHKQMLPQFAKSIVYKLHSKNLAIGLTIFVLGLFKKVVLADGISVYATPVFDAAEAGIVLTIFEAWGGAFAYTFQLYFDFSGYSDMAIGAARMFNIYLPINFNSPYKATSIIDFWRRWHITLSHFLKDYLYISLGGSRKGKFRRHVNLMVTMILGGLWHGAGWTFVLWGALHGFYLVINHTWRAFFKIKTKSGVFFAWMLTFLAVVISWVPFRAETIDGALNIIAGMFGLNGLHLSPALQGYFGTSELWLFSHGVIIQEMFRFGSMVELLAWIIALGLISVIMPNTQQVMFRYYSEFETYMGKIRITRPQKKYLEWHVSQKKWVIFISILFVLSVLHLSHVSEFIYFQF